MWHVNPLTTAAAVAACRYLSCRQEAAPVAAAAAAPAASATADDPGDFKWTEHWYPVHTLESADPARPHAVELLGRQLVLWRDGQGQWQCMEDACPHR